jgi:hypothetical protein
MSKPKIKLGIVKAEVESSKPLIEQDFYSLSKLNEYIKEIVENNVFFMFIELLKKIEQDYGDKGLSFDELQGRYLSYFKKNLKNSNIYCEMLSLNLNTDINQLTKINESVTSQDSEKESDMSEKETTEIAIKDSKCYARTSTNTQCSRKKQKGTNFCGSHSHSQPYGRIDQPCIVDVRPKKRGRPPLTLSSVKKPEPAEKTPSETDPPKTDMLQIEATIENIGGIDYVVDNNTNKIYKLITLDDDKINTPPIEEDEINIDNLKLVGQKLPNKQVIWYSDVDLMFINK